MYTVRNPIACQGKSSTGNCVRASDTRADHSLRFKDVCKRDLLLAEMNPNTSGVFAPDRDAWRHGVKEGALRAKTKARRAARNVLSFGPYLYFPAKFCYISNEV